jgi:ABC-2 type transport system permease protein
MISKLTIYKVGLYTMLRKDIKRLFRIWTQTLLPSVITTSLYFAIFGSLIGSQIAPTEGFSYMHFIMPGLVMMTIITNSYMHSSMMLFMTKFQRNIDELLVSPMPRALIVAGFLLGSLFRSILIGVLVIGVSLLFAPLTIFNIGIVFISAVLASIVFSSLGLINALVAKSFDGINFVPTFILTPLTYFGGVFYSISLLPEPWQTLSHFNPILYMVNTFRYGFLGISDVSIVFSFTLMTVLAGGLLAACVWLFVRGTGLEK